MTDTMQLPTKVKSPAIPALMDSGSIAGQAIHRPRARNDGRRQRARLVQGQGRSIFMLGANLRLSLLWKIRCEPQMQRRSQPCKQRRRMSALRKLAVGIKTALQCNLQMLASRDEWEMQEHIRMSCVRYSPVLTCTAASITFSTTLGAYTLAAAI